MPTPATKGYSPAARRVSVGFGTRSRPRRSPNDGEHFRCDLPAGLDRPKPTLTRSVKPRASAHTKRLSAITAWLFDPDPPRSVAG